MPITNFALKVTAFAVFGVASGYAAMALFSQSGHENMTKQQIENLRKPASNSLKTAKVSGKHLAVVTVEIIPPKNLPEDSAQEVELVGRITLYQSIDSDLEYSWTLPEGVTVVDGLESDGYAGVKAGQTVEVRLAITGFSRSEQKVITLQASAKKGALEFGNSAVIVSRPEDTWESVAPEMKRAAEELAQE